jgi:hypothetical protein
MGNVVGVCMDQVKCRGSPDPGDPISLSQAQEDPPQQPYRPATGQPKAPAMGAGADQRQQAQEGRRRGFSGAEGANSAVPGATH